MFCPLVGKLQRGKESIDQTLRTESLSASVLLFFIVSYHADSGRSLDSLSECWYGSLQGPSRRRPWTVALSWQQAVRFKGKHPITVIRNIQELTVTPRRPQALHWLVSDLYGNTGLQPEQKKVWNIISRKLTERFLISIHLSATSEMATNPVFVTLTQHDMNPETATTSKLKVLLMSLAPIIFYVFWHCCKDKLWQLSWLF